MKHSRILLTVFLILCLALPFNVMAIKLIYKDNKGYYHYRCTDKTGGITRVIYRAEGVYVNGPNGQQFFPANTAEIVRSLDYIKITEKYTRWGCREKLIR